MKILVVTSNYPRWRGDSTTPFVHNFAKELINQGCQVRVIAPHFEGSKKRETLEGVEVFRFRYWYPIKAQTVCYQGGALGNLEKKPIEKIKIPALVLFEILSVLYHVLFWKPDCINSHWLIPQGFASALVSKVTGTFHVASVHGGDVFALNNRLLRKFKRFVINSADIVTVNSSVTEAKVRDISPHMSTPLTRIPTGILPLAEINGDRVVALRQTLMCSPDERLILYVGRLAMEKGVGDLILAIKALQTSGRNYRLVIVGEGHCRDDLVQMARANHIINQVTFVGWIDNREIYNYFHACDIFVGPSKKGVDGWIEAQGLTFVEAMLAGCAVIGSRSGGITDSVIPDKTGRLVNPGDIKNIAQTISDALDNREETNRLIDNAKLYAEDNYLITNSTARFLSLLYRNKIECT